MIEVELLNNDGQCCTTVNIHETEKPANAVTWGSRIFFWIGNRNKYQEGLIVPAIINKSTK